MKILESNNIKLRSVISSIKAKSAMDMIRMLATGITDKEQLAGCARSQVKRKKEALIKALDGTLASHHLVQLQILLQDFDHVQIQLNTLKVMITEITQAYYSLAYECLDSITGIAGRSAQIILSEAGNDMSRFTTADHLTAWCGLAPGNHESAGKRRETSVKQGNPCLKQRLLPLHGRQ